MAISGDRPFDGIRFGVEDAVDYGALDAELTAEPAHVSWSRLEPLSLTTGALDIGLAAPVADPLWLMCRQRQFGELAAEDGGSAIDVEVVVEHAALDRIGAGLPSDDGSGVAPLDPGTLLEAEIEAEPVVQLPERIRAEAGQQLLRMLRAADAASLVDDVLEIWAFDPADDALRAADPRGAARRSLLAGRVPDGVAVAADLIDAGTVGGRAMLTLGRVTIASALRVRVRDAVSDWRDWLADYLHQPTVGFAWDSSRLAYSFAVSARMSGGEVTLRADEYDSGTIDWYSFDHDPDAVLDADPERPGSTTTVHRGIPQPARYPGMPVDRYWEVEDTEVFFGGVDVAPGDLAALALIDFGVQGGTDWFQIPLELPVGALVRVISAEIRTTFGETVTIPAAIGEDTSAWTAFELASHVPDGPPTDVFLHAQTGRGVMIGPPLEEVELIRDEMANMAWAIEHIVQGPTGEPAVRRSVVRPQGLGAAPVDLEDAQLVYRLMSAVADNWHPLVPVVTEKGRGTRRPTLALELRQMVRASETGDAELAPGTLGELMRAPADDERLRIAEESVPREGVRLTRRYEAARTSDGRYIIWIGRGRRVADRYPPSDLEFDFTEPPAG